MSEITFPSGGIAKIVGGVITAITVLFAIRQWRKKRQSAARSDHRRGSFWRAKHKNIPPLPHTNPPSSEPPPHKEHHRSHSLPKHSYHHPAALPPIRTSASWYSHRPSIISPKYRSRKIQPLSAHSEPSSPLSPSTPTHTLLPTKTVVLNSPPTTITSKNFLNTVRNWSSLHELNPKRLLTSPSNSQIPQFHTGYTKLTPNPILSSNHSSFVATPPKTAWINNSSVEWPSAVPTITGTSPTTFVHNSRRSSQSKFIPPSKTSSNSTHISHSEESNLQSTPTQCSQITVASA